MRSTFLGWAAHLPRRTLYRFGNSRLLASDKEFPLGLVAWKPIQLVPDVGTLQAAKVTSFLRSLEFSFESPLFYRDVEYRRLQIAKSLLYRLGTAVMPALICAAPQETA
jgi:hypothetical protein